MYAVLYPFICAFKITLQRLDGNGIGQKRDDKSFIILLNYGLW